MVTSRIILLALTCLLAKSNGFPDGLRAKSIPFGNQIDNNQFIQRSIFQAEPQAQVRPVQPVQPQNFFIVRDVPEAQKQVIQSAPQFRTENSAQQLRSDRVIPQAPTLADEEKAKESPLLVFRSSQPVQAQAGQILRTKEDEAALFKKQAESAHYAFDTFVDDGINGHSHLRSEKRNGLAVEGMYSYSDGFYRRTIHYAADDKGYRVTKEEVEPIGEGPLIDPNGEAVVRSSLGSQYVITKADLQSYNSEKAKLSN